MAPGDTTSDAIVLSDSDDEGGGVKQRGLPAGRQVPAEPPEPPSRASGPELDEEDGGSASEQEASAGAPLGLPSPIPSSPPMGLILVAAPDAPLQAAGSAKTAGAEAADVSDGDGEDGGESEARLAAVPVAVSTRPCTDVTGLLVAALNKQDGEDKEAPALDQDVVRARAEAVADALKYLHAGAANAKRNQHTRALCSDLGRNGDLRRRVLRGEVTPAQLVAMSTYERQTVKLAEKVAEITAIALAAADLSAREREAEVAKRNLAILAGRDGAVAVPAGLLHGDAGGDARDSDSDGDDACANDDVSAPASPAETVHATPGRDDGVVLDFKAFCEAHLAAEAAEAAAAEDAAAQDTVEAPLPVAEPAPPPPAAAPVAAPMLPAAVAPSAAAAAPVAAAPAAAARVDNSCVVQLERVSADSEPANVRAGTVHALGAGGAELVQGVQLFIEGGGVHSARFAKVLLRDVRTAQRLRTLDIIINGDRVDALAERDAREPHPGAIRVRGSIKQSAPPPQEAPAAAPMRRADTAPRDAAVVAAAVAERGRRSVQLTVTAGASKADVRAAAAHALATACGGNYLAETARIEDVRMREDGGRFGRYADVYLTDVPTAELLRRLPIIVAGQQVEVRAAGERGPRKDAKRMRETSAAELPAPRKKAREDTPPLVEEATEMERVRQQLLKRADPRLSATGVCCLRCLEPGFSPKQMVPALPPATTAPACVACLVTMYCEFKNSQNAAMPAAAGGTIATQPAAIMAPAVAPAPCLAQLPPPAPVHLVVELLKSAKKQCLAELHPLVAAGAALPSPPQPPKLDVNARVSAADALAKLAGATAQQLHAWDVLPAGAAGLAPLEQYIALIHKEGKTVGVVTDGLPPGGRMFIFPRQEAGAARLALGLPASPHALMLAVYVAPAPLS